MVAEVYRLSDYNSSGHSTNASATAQTHLTGLLTKGDVSAISVGTQSAKSLGYSGDPEMLRLFELTGEIDQRLSVASQLFGSGEIYAAEDEFLRCLPLLDELRMFRNISDGLGLVSTHVFRLASRVRSISSSPEHLTTI